MARRNPFRSEAEAFRLVLLTIAAFAAIAAATLLGGWAVGLAVAVAVVAVGLWWYLKPLEESSEQQASTHVSAPRASGGSSSSRTRPWRGRSSARRSSAPRPATARTCSSSRRPSTRSCGTGCPTRTGRARPRQGRLADSLARLAAGGHRRARRGRRRRSRPVDRRRAADVRRRRGHHLDAPGGPVELARARRRRHRARALRRADHPRRRRPRGAVATEGLRRSRSRAGAVVRRSRPELAIDAVPGASSPQSRGALEIAAVV